MKPAILATAAFAAAVHLMAGQAAWAQAGRQDSAYQICQRAGIAEGSAAMTDCIRRLGAEARPENRWPGTGRDGLSDQQAELPETLGDDIRRRSGPVEPLLQDEALPGPGEDMAPPRDLPAAPNSAPPDIDGRQQR